MAKNEIPLEIRILHLLERAICQGARGPVSHRTVRSLQKLLDPLARDRFRWGKWAQEVSSAVEALVRGCAAAGALRRAGFGDESEIHRGQTVGTAKRWLNHLRSDIPTTPIPQHYYRVRVEDHAPCGGARDWWQGAWSGRLGDGGLFDFLCEWPDETVCWSTEKNWGWTPDEEKNLLLGPGSPLRIERIALADLPPLEDDEGAE